ncbi:ABC transporter permease [Kitasatospora sp. MMS16-BH015]|uniref:ABC transporter permease subunit n=1 Tax=Kitasatospora sp. MMS16-BH015 TaxID=2018025 RepID=UPI000CA38512|nr:ABC transporter permease subunit [Kitasatospora sp. MMS16-BH015]AUG75076.1 ABC transporter permease [Kitasatospora sp. MMS16-BH015]
MAATTFDRPDQAGPRFGRRFGLRGTAWLSARQERTAFLIGGGLLLAVCAWLLFLGGVIQHYVTVNHLEGCNVVYFPPECEGRGSQLAESLDPLWQPAVEITGWVLFALPPALGLFLGAPLLAREFETGTYRLAWTQSVSRRRWLAARLGVPLAVTLLGSTLLAVVSTWWVNVIEGRFAVPGYYHWFTWLSRSTEGPAVVGFSLLGVALGAAVGLVTRRVVASMAVTAVLMLVLRLAIDALRFLLTPARTSVIPARMGLDPGDPHTVIMGGGHLGTHVPLESLNLETGLISSDGTHLPLPSDWIDTLPDGRILCTTDACHTHPDVVQAYTQYQPPTAHWPMLWAETGLSLLLAALLVGFSFLWIRRIR